MARLIGSVLLGYIAMAFAVFAGLSLAYVALGADRAFIPGAFEVSAIWIGVSILVGFLAALLGGWVARKFGGTATGPRWLAVLVLFLGLGVALAALLGDPPPSGLRTDAVGTFQAMQFARTPLWMMFLNPLIGVLGVLIGGKALGTGESDSPRGVAAPTP